MRNDNIAYDDSDSTLGFITEQVFWGGVTWAGVSLITDPKGFKETIDKVGKKVFPETAPDLGAYHTEMQNLRSSLVSTAYTRAVNVPRDLAARKSAMLAANPPVDMSKLKGVSLSGVEDLSSTATRFVLDTFKYNKIDEVADVTGKALGYRIKKAFKDMPLDIDQSGITFLGTKAKVPYLDKDGNTREFFVHFAKQDDNGNNIVRNGQAFYSAPSTMKYGMNPKTRELTGNLLIQDHNTQLLELLSDQDKVYRLAAMSKEVHSILPTEAYNRVIRSSTMKTSLDTTMKELRSLDYGIVLKMALKEFQGTPTWVSPGNAISLAKQSGMVRTDKVQMNEISADLPGFDLSQLGKTPAKPIWSTLRKRDNIGSNIKARYQTTLNASSGQIFLNGMPLDHPLLEGVRLAEDLSYGITSNASQSQIADSTFYAGGGMYGPTQAEGWKTVSDYGWTQREVKGKTWRMAPRYKAEGGTAGRVSIAVEKNRGILNTFGYINFAGDEEIMLNKSMYKMMNVDTPIQVGFRGFTPEIEKGKITVKSVNGGEGIDFEYGDLTNGRKELYDYFTGANKDKYEIHFSGGMALGVKDPSKPISGILHGGILHGGGIKDEAEILRLEYGARMNQTDVSNFQQMLKNNPDNISMTMRISSPVTKVGVGTTTARSSITYFDLSGELDGPGAIEEFARITGNRNIESLYGANLFKNALMSYKGQELTGLKGSSDLMGFAHSMIGGMAVEASGKTAQHTILKGDIAERFGAMLGIKPENGVLNLTKIINDGKFTFNINATDREAYAGQLKTTMEVLGGLRSQYEAKTKGTLVVDDDTVANPKLLEEFTQKYENAGKLWKEYQSTGKTDKSQIRKYLFPLLTANTPLEERILSQGKGQFNTARFAMRDLGSFLGKQNILKELLIRSDTDAMQMMREAELLDMSVGGQTGQAEFEGAANNYINDLKAAHKDNPEALKQIKSLEASLGGMTDEAAAVDMAEWSGAEVGLPQMRETPDSAINSFFNPERNMFGKFVRTEGGGRAFIPSASAFGEATLLAKDNKVTFEKHAATFFQVAEEVSKKGYVSRETMDRLGLKIKDAAQVIRDERSKIQIHNATYSKAVADKKIAGHDVIQLFEENKVGSEEARAIMGQMATISRKDIRSSFQHELLKSIERAKHTGHTVTEELNAMHGQNHYLAENYGSHIKSLTANSTGRDVAKTVRNILEVEQEKSQKLASLLNEAQLTLQKHGQGGTNLEVIQKQIAEHVTKNSMMLQIQRDPKIYSESDPVVHGFMDISATHQDVFKRIGLGHMTNVMTKADIDGDALKSVILFAKSSQDEARRLIITTQKFTHELMVQHDNRADLAKNISSETAGRTFNLHGNYDEFAQHAFGLGEASSYAAFFTKAYTGSMNSASIRIKNTIEKSLTSASIKDKEKLFELLAWGRTVPSMILEQPIISSKHLSAVIRDAVGTKVAGKTNSEKMIDAIKGLDNEKLMEIMKESEGTLDPMVIMALSEANSFAGQRAKMMVNGEGAINHGSTLLDLHYNWRSMNDNDFKLMRTTKGAQMNDTQYVAWKDAVQEHQRNFTPMSERGVTDNTDLANKTMLDITTESRQETNGNTFEMLQNIERKTSGIGGISMLKPHELDDLIYNESKKVFSHADEMIGLDIVSNIPKATRRIIGWDKLAGKIDKVTDWIKESPKERLGGIALVGMAAIAASNLLFGDGTPTDPSDLPSVSNPHFGGSRGRISGNGVISSRSSYNMSNSLLSDSSQNLGSIHSSLNSLVGLQGHNVVSVKHDTTDPYLDKMSYYR